MFCRMFLNLGFSAFLMLDWVMDFGGKTTEVSKILFSPHHIKSTYINMTSQLMFMLITQLRLCLLDVPIVRSFPPLRAVLFTKKLFYMVLHFSGGELCSIFLRAEYLH